MPHHAHTILDEVRRDVAANGDALRVARERLAAVRHAADSFPDALRTFASGSLATRFVNDPVTDGDGGVVIDRRTRPHLGPDGDGDMPAALVEEVRQHVAAQIHCDFPGAAVEPMKRGIIVEFHDPLPSGEDPSIDLVVALNRRGHEGLWIPNLDDNRWNPSHPERHVELFTAGWESLRRARQHVVRVAKAQIKQFETPAICSFNIAALAWECIELPERLDLALHRFYDYAATELSCALTEDPAGVSAPIRVADRTLAVNRFRMTADAIALAIEADDATKAREILSRYGVFWKLVDAPADGLGALHHAIDRNQATGVSATGALSVASATCAPIVKSTRSFGGEHR